MNRIAHNLTQLIKAFGLGQEDAGKVMGVSQRSIAYYLIGRGKPKQLALQRFADYVGLPDIEALTGQEISWKQALELAQAKQAGGVMDTDVPYQVRLSDATRRFLHFYEQHPDGQPGAALKEIAAGRALLTVDQLLQAQQADGLNPLYVLGYSDLQETGPGGNDPAYGAAHYDEAQRAQPQRHERIGQVIDSILKKHQTPRERYAKENLHTSSRTLQRLVKGEINPAFATVAQIAEDHGESLDLFRKLPLPKGHLLTLLEEKDRRIAALEELLAVYRLKESA